MDRLNEKLDRIAEDLSEIKASQAATNQLLADRGRRIGVLEDDVRPLKAQAAFISAAAKIFSVMVAVGGLIAGIVRALNG